MTLNTWIGLIVLGLALVANAAIVLTSRRTINRIARMKGHRSARAIRRRLNRG